MWFGAEPSRQRRKMGRPRSVTTGDCRRRRPQTAASSPPQPPLPLPALRAVFLRDRVPEIPYIVSGEYSALRAGSTVMRRRFWNSEINQQSGGGRGERRWLLVAEKVAECDCFQEQTPTVDDERWRLHKMTNSLWNLRAVGQVSNKVDSMLFDLCDSHVRPTRVMASKFSTLEFVVVGAQW